MTDSNPLPTPNDLTRQLLGLLLSSIATNWRGIWARIGRLLGRRPRPGLYEILDYDVTLDLPDPSGKTAIFRRRQKVRFLQDHVIAYQDEAWGDGDVMADYKCSPGVPVDHFQIGSRHMILISLRETKNRGDKVEFNIERTVRNGFTKDEEWLEAETRYPTRRLRVRIVFPEARPCLSAKLVERRRDRATILGEKYFEKQRDGRQVLGWSRKRPPLGESYTFSWRW